MTKETPTGIPITVCDFCGREHPVTRSHCASCFAPSLFLDDREICIPCSQLPGQSTIDDVLEASG